MDLQSSLTLTAIIIALIIGVRSVVQTKNIQIAERKQRLLNEIIDWTNDLLLCSSEMHVQPIPGITRKAHMLHATSALYLRYRAMNARSKYVEKIASEFGQDLDTTVKPVISKLRKFVKLLEENITALNSGFDIANETREKTSKCELELYALIRSLIEKTAEIKVKEKSSKVQEDKQVTKNYREKPTKIRETISHCFWNYNYIYRMEFPRVSCYSTRNSLNCCF